MPATFSSGTSSLWRACKAAATEREATPHIRNQPRERSGCAYRATVIRRPFVPSRFNWWKGRDSNPRPRHYETAAMLDHLDLKKARWRISPISGTINENWLSAFAPSQV